MRRLVLIALTTFALAFAPAPFPKQKPARQGDSQRIQGNWVLTMQGYNGRQNRAAGDTRWVFGQGKMQIVNGTNRYDWTYAIDPNARPRTLDLSYSGSPLKALYAIENDTLTITYNSGNWNQRPASLTSSDGSTLVMTFRRERP
jgi:uncharacterized protein (TIGR03067 family)